MIQISFQSVTPPSVKSKPENSIFTVCDYCQKPPNTCNNSVREMHAWNQSHWKFFNCSHKIYIYICIYIYKLYTRSATVLNTIKNSKYEIFLNCKNSSTTYFTCITYMFIYILIFSCNIWREYLSQDKHLRINFLKF